MRTTPTPLAFAMASACLATLASCGGGGNGGDPAPQPAEPVTLSGTVVVDQAIQNAVVCLDLNANGACDAAEPASARTDASGAYRLSYDPAVVTATQAAAASLIAPMVPGAAADAGTTMDATNPGQPNTAKAYVLRQAPGKSGQINPLTTLVAAGVAAGMTEAAARANAAIQLGIDQAKIDNYQDDPASDPAMVQDTARTVAAFTADALEAGAVLQVGDPAASLPAEADTLIALFYFDAANYFVSTTGLPAKVAGSAERIYTDQRSQRMAGTPVTAVRALYPSIYLAPSGWQRCDASTLHPATLGNPSRSTFCGTQKAIAYRTPPVDIGGKPMAEVINQLQADPASTSINKNLTTAGLLAAAGTAAFTAGAQLQKTTALVLAQPLFVSETSTQARPQAEATTLEQLVAAKPASGVNLATSAGSLSLGVSTSTLRNLRVAFTGVTGATAGTVQYYDCDLNAANTVSSNCSATSTGTYHVDTVNGVRVMRFAGLPPTPASGETNFYAEVKGTATGDYIYRVRQVKPTLALNRTASNRLDATAWAALKAQLGL